VMSDQNLRISYIGLGVMGSPIARHLAAAGHHLRVYNRTSAKAEAWVAANGGEIADTPAAAGEGADVVITCVGNDDDLASVTFGPDGCFHTMSSGALFIDHTTVSAKIARLIAADAQARGIKAVDAPVSGGQAGAENGALSIMCGADEAAFAVAEPIMQAYASRIVHIGPAGAGQTAKMCNQIAIAGVLQGLSEALTFAEASELDTDKVFEAISGGAASSWQMLNRWPTMAKREFDFGFAIDWMRKDLGLALDEARNNGATLPVAALVDQFYAEAQAMGHGRSDTSALIERLGR
jgi:3-hydroxyisobutyrate dehydrogenase